MLNNRLRFLSRMIYPFVLPLAKKTGIDAYFLNNLYNTNEKEFDRIEKLADYLENDRLGITPRLSKTEILSLANDQECLNLQACYPFIKQGWVTVDEAKTLSEDNRVKLLTQNDESFVKDVFKQNQQQQLPRLRG